MKGKNSDKIFYKNMNMKRLIILSMLTVMLTGRMAAQQIPLYSEMYFLRMLYNPALTSYNGSTDLYGFYRDQWTAIPGHPVTGGALGDMSLWNDRIGVGFHVYSDKTSIIQRLNAQLYYAQKIHVAKDHIISLGVSAGIMNTYIDFNNAVVNDPDDAQILSSARSGIGFDMNVGLAYQWKKKLTIGFSVPQVLNMYTRVNTQLKDATYLMQRHFIGSASYEISLANEKYNIEPCVMVTKGPSQPIQVDGSVTFNYKRLLYVGLGYRMNYGFSAMAAVRIDKTVTIGYAFDAPFTMQGANFSQTKGTHEIILGINFDRWLKKKGAKDDNMRQSQLDSLIEANKEMQKSIDTIKQEIDSLKQNADSLKHNVDSLRQNTDAVQTQQQQQQQQHDQQLKDHDQELKNIQERVDSFENLMRGYKKTVSERPPTDFPTRVDKTTTASKGDIFRLNSVNFERNSSFLEKSSYPELDKVVTFLENNPNMRIRINGHTDYVASDEYNQWLSDNRAKRVYDYLVKKGIPESRMVYIGFGKRMPIADNSTDEGRARNRRVEIEVLK